MVDLCRPAAPEVWIVLGSAVHRNWAGSEEGREGLFSQSSNAGAAIKSWPCRHLGFQGAFVKWLWSRLWRILPSSLLSLQSQEVHEEFAFVLQIRIENSWCLDSRSICATGCWVFLCGLNHLCKRRVHVLDEASRILMYSDFRSMDSCAMSLLSSFFLSWRSSRLATQWDKTEAHSRWRETPKDAGIGLWWTIW